MKFILPFLLLTFLQVRAIAAIQATNLIVAATLPAASTNVSAAYVVTGTLTINAQTFWITHGSLGNYGTNAVTIGGAYEISFDGGTSWVTVANFVPSTTNSATEAYTPSLSAIQPLSRFRMTNPSTNSVTNLTVNVGFSL